MSYPIYLGCDHDVNITDSRQASTGQYINDATVTYTLNGPTGVITAGTLSYVASSDGNYKAVIPSSVTSQLAIGGTYTIVIVFASSRGNDERLLAFICQYRGSN